MTKPSVVKLEDVWVSYHETLALKARRVPRRLTPARVSRAVRARLGQDVSHLPIPGLAEPEPQRSADRANR